MWYKVAWTYYSVPGNSTALLPPCCVQASIPCFLRVTADLFGKKLAPKNIAAEGTSSHKYMRSEQILHAEKAEDSSLAPTTDMASRRLSIYYDNDLPDQVQKQV